MKGRRIFYTLALAVVMSGILCGCVGKEPNEIAYVVALGIDSGENGNYKVTIQYANPSKISGGAESGKSDGNVVENIVLEAPTIYSAVDLANQIDSNSFSLSHTKVVVFSQEIAEKGLKDLTEIFIRSEELRPDVYLAVAAGSAQNYLESVNPVMEVNPAKYYQLVFDKNKLIGLPEGIEKNFFFGIETGDYDSVLPVAGVINGGSEDSENDEEKDKENTEQKTKTNSKEQEAPVNEKPFEYRVREYIAGQNALELKTKSEVMGSAVFRGDKMIGILGSIETEIYRLLDSGYQSSYFTFYSSHTPNSPVTIKITQKKAPKYVIDAKNKKINVTLFLDGDIYSIPSGYNIENDISEFENECQNYIASSCGEFMKKIVNEYESDIFRFNERSKKRFLTAEKYNEYKKQVDYKEFDINVDVNFDIRRTGLVIREQ